MDGSRRRRVKLAGLVAVGATAGAVAVAGLAGGSDRPRASSAPIAPEGISRAAAVQLRDLQPCRPGEAPVGFDAFSLGGRFAGLRLSHVLRRCSRPQVVAGGIRGANSAATRYVHRANFTSYLYG